MLILIAAITIIVRTLKIIIRIRWIRWLLNMFCTVTGRVCVCARASYLPFKNC